ncbi:molybdopterin oxidoreductase [Clostridium polyendosporum]|uniref:Molybdopterin oxidoreductase n=1 Tax=Clostridium polyendosporum TaxID=69208 RepID=A0A919S0X9_9CLOT|nr:DUF1667 domain-containing protein [Clostridium polyendosporum]GIM29248.1 molybdopterin oxidoreductase [Clostridium polyendosporum]
MVFKVICTVCPNGCKMNIHELSAGNYDIIGYRCEKGKKYAEQEITNPARILTATIKINNGFIKRLPVRSKESIPKNTILKIIEILKKVEIEAPVSVGDIIIENILGTGINIIASKSVPKIFY